MAADGNIMSCETIPSQPNVTLFDRVALKYRPHDSKKVHKFEHFASFPKCSQKVTHNESHDGNKAQGRTSDLEKCNTQTHTHNLPANE